MSIQYSGGTYVSTTFLGDTKADIISALQTQLTNAGWSVVSGSGTTNLLMQTAQASGSNNQGRVRFKDNGGTCVQVTIENVSGSAVQTQSTTHGGNLMPGASTTYRIQFFCFVPGPSAAGQFVCAGILYVPSFLQGVVTEAIYMCSNAQNDSGTLGACFRNSLSCTTCNATYNPGNHASIVNGSLYDHSNSSSNYTADITLIVPQSAYAVPGQTSFYQSAYRYHDLSCQIVEPLLAVGAANQNDEALIRGQLYDCRIMTDVFTIDTGTSFSDGGTSHNFWCLTGSNSAGNNQAVRGSLWVATS